MTLGLRCDQYEPGLVPRAVERLEPARGRAPGTVEDDDERVRTASAGRDEHLRSLAVPEREGSAGPGRSPPDSVSATRPPPLSRRLLFVVAAAARGAQSTSASARERPAAPSPGPTAASAAAAAAAAREAAAAAGAGRVARAPSRSPRRGRRSRARSGRTEIPGRRDPVERALAVQAPPASAAVRPGGRAPRSRRRFRRRDSAPRARASPAAPPGGAGSRSDSGGTPPSAPPRSGPPSCGGATAASWRAESERRGVDARAEPECDLDDVAPARRGRAEAVDPGAEQDRSRRRRRRPRQRSTSPRRLRTSCARDRRGDLGLELVKRSLLPARSSSIRSRNAESRSARASDHRRPLRPRALRSRSAPTSRANGHWRSATSSWRSPPQTLRSVVTGIAS